MAAALQMSCSLISPAPRGAFGAPASALSFAPRGRRERSFPGLALRAQNRGGVQPTADRFFVEERDRVMSRYVDIIDIDHGCLYMEATAMSGQVCLSADQALETASRVMGSACVSLGTPNEISRDTVRMTLGAYARLFLEAADASYNRTVSKKTVMSFLGALRGLASISHILLEGALEALSHTHPRESLSEYAFNCDVKAMHDDFNRQMSQLEDGIREAPPVKMCKLVMPAILEATTITQSFVGLMVARRQRVQAIAKPHVEVVA